MMLSWKIRYLDRTDKQFKDRYLTLLTETLDPVLRAAIEFVAEADSRKTERDILKYRHLFQEQSLDSLKNLPLPLSGFRPVGPSEYFEDETGAEITGREIGPILTGSPTAVLVRSGTKQYEIDLMLAKRTPIPLEQVSLTQGEIDLLGNFTRDLAELSGSAFMKDGPGRLKFGGPGSSPTTFSPTLETAVTDEEIRSFVTIFRRLYMEKEPANLKKAVAVYFKALGNHPYARFVAGMASDYEAYLTSSPYLPPLIQTHPVSFDTKRLLDVFIYTQYAHQPTEARQRQFNECLGQAQGNRSLLTWMFLTEIWKCTLQVGNIGRIIAKWFRHYCNHHGVIPDVLNSLSHEQPGLGTVEKEADRKARLFREKAEELATDLWKEAGRPEGGPVQFREAAHEQLHRALEGGEAE